MDLALMMMISVFHKKNVQGDMKDLTMMKPVNASPREIKKRCPDCYITYKEVECPPEYQSIANPCLTSFGLPPAYCNKKSPICDEKHGQVKYAEMKVIFRLLKTIQLMILTVTDQLRLNVWMRTKNLLLKTRVNNQRMMNDLKNNPVKATIMEKGMITTLAATMIAVESKGTRQQKVARTEVNSEGP
jgi:hypothetical protein